MKDNLTAEDIEKRLQTFDHIAHMQVRGDGRHFQLLLVSDQFLDKSKLARQQLVYSKLKDFIAAGRLHALTMTTLTTQEWEQQNG